MAIFTAGVPDLIILNSEKSLESKSWVTKNASGTTTERVLDTEKNWSTTKNLSKYKKVHFLITGGKGTRSINVGSVSMSNPGTGEKVLDISSITTRTALEIKLHVNAAPATDPTYVNPETGTTNVTTYSIKVSKIWATAN